MSETERPRGGAWVWLRFRLILVGLVVCRGLVWLCLLPPFEGWDEYQHLGYIVALTETGQRQVWGEALLPRALLEQVVRFPQSRHALEQIGSWGAISYQDYWDRRSPGTWQQPQQPPRPGTTTLYEAQHGPLYYRLMAPLFLALGGLTNLAATVACLRLVNLALTAGAVWLALGTIGRLIPRTSWAMVVGLLVATQPLFLINGVRIANDALGVFLATCVIGQCLELRPDRLLLRSASVGLLTGLAIAAKAVHLGLLPFVAMIWLMAMIGHRLRWRKAVASVAMLALGVLLPLQEDLRFNLAHYGSPVSMQETIKARAETGGGGGSTSVAWPRLARKLEQLWFHDNLLVGGWSSLRPSRKLLRNYERLAIAAALGWLSTLIGPLRKRTARLCEARVLFGCLLLCLSYAAALAYHMIQSQRAWGLPTTGPWYACAAMPWFLLLLAGGSLCWPWPRDRTRFLLPLPMVFLFLWAEVSIGWGTMPVFYSGGASGWEALRRLASLQPSWLGTPTLLAATMGEAVLFGLAVLWLVKESLESMARSSPTGRPHLFQGQGLTQHSAQPSPSGFRPGSPG